VLYSNNSEENEMLSYWSGVTGKKWNQIQKLSDKASKFTSTIPPTE